MSAAVGYELAAARGKLFPDDREEPAGVDELSARARVDAAVGCAFSDRGCEGAAVGCVEAAVLCADAAVMDAVSADGGRNAETR